MVIKGYEMTFFEKFKIDLEKKIDKIIGKYGFEVVELQVQNLKDGILLRVFIDHIDEKEITLKDCEFISKLIDSSLGGEEIDLAMLEVSSPGIDRLIKKEKDFKRFRGSNIKITLDREVKKKKKLVGKLQDIKNDVIEINVKEEILFIPLSYIKEVRLYVSDEDIKDYLKRRKV